MDRPRRTLTTIDAHAGGEPLRLITSGVPPLRGATILERRAEMLEQHDDIRQSLMWEPRGHADMYGAILTPPVTPEADYGVLFMHNEGYSTMCGHGIIAVTTILIETGAVGSGQSSAVSVGYDTPAGFVRARATVDGGRVTQVAFENVASFVFSDAIEIRLQGGRYTVPVVFGGAFYALAPAEMYGLDVVPQQAGLLIELGMEVKRAVEAKLEVVHPFDPGLRGVYGTILTGEPSDGADGRNVTIFADGEVDRSPCGTGTAARLAWLHARGELPSGRSYVHESIIGSRFTGRVLRETTVGDRPAIVPEVGGSASVTGYHTFVVDPGDPLRAGFLVR